MTGRTEACDGHDEVTVVLGRFDALVARGLVAVLREDPRVRVLASDLEDCALREALVELAPQVTIVDEQAQRSLSVARTGGATGVLVLACDPKDSYGMQLLGAGVACVARDASVEAILTAVHLVAEGGRMFAPSDGRKIERRYPVGAQALTPRELQVLEHVSAGRSSMDAALALRISVETVRAHTASIRRKLGVRSRRELVGMPIPAPAAGLVDN
jgi:DNA-binding NarL/FixJ family response regulator